MNGKKLRVTTLGEFTISYGDKVLQDTNGRAYKTWLLLAYLLCNRARMVSNREIANLLGADPAEAGTANAIRQNMFRVRRVLAGLGLEREDVIVSGVHMYGWNPEVEVDMDAERFESLCREVKGGGEEALSLARQAMELYRGDFLARYHGEEWAEQTAHYYQSMYLETVETVLPRLISGGEAEGAVRLCRAAIRCAPYHEALYRMLMRGYAAQEDYHAVADAYEELRGKLLTELDVVPDEETTACFRELMLHSREKVLTVDAIRQMLQSDESLRGPLICDCDNFKMFYRAEARAASRRGDAIHIAILTLSGKGGRPLSERSMQYAMEKLRQALTDCLRSGDIAAQWSVTQFVLMLIQANYESSQMVCRRISRRFGEVCPRTSALLQAVVIPLETAEP